MRRARTDENQQAIIDALCDVGATVHSLHRVGQGCPDLLVGYHGTNFLVEVKNPGARGKLTQAQVHWVDMWRGQVAVVETVEQALYAIGALTPPEVA